MSIVVLSAAKDLHVRVLRCARDDTIALNDMNRRRLETAVQLVDQ